MLFSRSKVLDCAKMCVGVHEGTNEHKMICGTYNGWAKQHKMPEIKLTDAWCACFVSAVFIASNCSSIIPCEISCQRMINKCKSMRIWKELDSYIPMGGDLIFYDWDDNGKGDCVGWSDHVGIVESCINGVITVIEGNYSNSVKRRTIKVDARYIRGFAVPRYNNV